MQVQIIDQQTNTVTTITINGQWLEDIGNQAEHMGLEGMLASYYIEDSIRAYIFDLGYEFFDVRDNTGEFITSSEI